ncbi:MAG: threonine--tRNA ligase [Candidatus Woesearchaeota archaeon]
MDKITVEFPDGNKKEYDKGVRGIDIAIGISQKLGRDAVALMVNKELYDLNRPLEDNCTVRILTFDDDEGKQVYWHSTAHMLAQAVLELYPDAKLTIGPAIDDGFYYDFDHAPFSEKDLEKIEQRMLDIFKRKLDIVREDIRKEDAILLYNTNPYKLELIEEHDSLSLYRQGDFYDLCRGPHIPNTGMVKAIKILKSSGAYWRGNSNNKQLQRIYGISFPKKSMLDDYIDMLKEAEKRNHRKIGHDLELFDHFDMIGKGLPVWLPNGEIIRREVEKLALEVEEKGGYQRVSTPLLSKKELFEKSGHIPYYEDDMYPAMVMDDGTYYLKAMNCPLHHLIYSRKLRSYRDLPIRIAEYGICHRNELSGTLTGLLRVRSLNMNDAHIYCTKDQVKEEIMGVLNMIIEYFRIFNLDNYWFRLSKGDINNKKKYIDQPEHWKDCESILREVLTSLGVKFVEADDEAAFYGPKIDVQFKNVYGREETMSTVQLDFMARERFKLEYVDDKGNKNNNVFVIHRAPLSTHERFMAFLIEHYGGNFPLWLSPLQSVIIPLSDDYNDYSNNIKDKLKSKNIRVKVDDRQESVSYKVREAKLLKVPYILVIGKKEHDTGVLSVRMRNDNTISVPIDDFVVKAKNKIINREYDTIL